MSAAIVHTPATIGNTGEDSVMIAEELEMKAEMGETRASRFKVLGNSISTRIFRVVALGALLVGAAVLYTSISQGAADSQPASNQIGPVSPATANLTSADHDLAELPYDELSKNFFGISSPSGAMVANIDQDVAELPYDELTKNFFGISSPSDAMVANIDQDVAELPYDELTKNFFGIPTTTK